MIAPITSSVTIIEYKWKGLFGHYKFNNGLQQITASSIVYIAMTYLGIVTITYQMLWLKIEHDLLSKS